MKRRKPRKLALSDLSGMIESKSEKIVLTTHIDTPYMRLYTKFHYDRPSPVLLASILVYLLNINNFSFSSLE